MAELQGRRIQTGIAKESTRGTAEGSAAYTVPWSELEINPMDAKVLDEPTQGVIEDAVGNPRSEKWAEGTITAPIGVKHFGEVLVASLGSGSTVTDSPEAGANTHNFRVGQSAEHNSLTIFEDDPETNQRKYARAMVNSLELTAELGAYARYALGFTSERDQSASWSPSTVTEDRFLPQHITFETAADYATLGSGTTINVRSISLTVEKNVERDQNLGSEDPTDINNTQFVVTGEIEAVWRSKGEFWSPFTEDKNQALKIDMSNSDTTISGTSTNPQFLLQLPKVSWTEISRSISLNDLVTQTASFKALYDTAKGFMVDIDLVNGESSYFT